MDFVAFVIAFRRYQGPVGLRNIIVDTPTTFSVEMYSNLSIKERMYSSHELHQVFLFYLDYVITYCDINL